MTNDFNLRLCECHICRQKHARYVITKTPVLHNKHFYRHKAVTDAACIIPLKHMYEHFFLKNTKRKKHLFSLKILSGKTVKFFRCLFLSISVRQRAQTQSVRGHRSLYSSGTQVSTFFVFWCSRRLCYDMKLLEP